MIDPSNEGNCNQFSDLITQKQAPLCLPCWINQPLFNFTRFYSYCYKNKVTKTAAANLSYSHAGYNMAALEHCFEKRGVRVCYSCSGIDCVSDTQGRLGYDL